MGEKLKLASGREVALHDLTYDQREECESATTIKTYPDGSMEFVGQFRAQSLWCMYGLGLESKDGLNKYSDDELAEIGIAIMERARKVNPTRPDSSPSTSG